MIRAAYVLFLSCFATVASAECRDDRVTIVGDWGRASFTVDVADDAAEQSQGLMFVEKMPTFEGMLFIYNTPRTVSFWMKNTLIPLDMLFADPQGRVTHVHENAIPLDETPIPGGDDIQAVLEINGGMAARLGIAAGDVLQHPAFDANAAVPCK